MALVSLNLKPSDKQLREFGEITLCMCNLLGLIFFKGFGFSTGVLVALVALGTGVFLLSRISVRLVRPVYIGLIALTFPIGWVISHAIMALFYYLIIGGIGLVFKLIGRDPLNRRYDPAADTYWIPYSRNPELKDYFHQF